MPVNDVVKEIASRNAGSLMPEGNAPTDDNRPDGEPAPTTLTQAGGLPPWLHNQTLDDRSAISLVGTILLFVGIVRKIQ